MDEPFHMIRVKSLYDSFHARARGTLRAQSIARTTGCDRPGEQALAPNDELFDRGDLRARRLSAADSRCAQSTGEDDSCSLGRTASRWHDGIPRLRSG